MKNKVSKTELNIKKVLSVLLIMLLVFGFFYQLSTGSVNLPILIGSVIVIVKAVGVIKEKQK